MITAVLLYCGPVPSLPDLCLYKCLKFSLHCTISSVVFQNMMITAALLYCGSVFPPSTHVCTSFSVHGTISSVVCQNMMLLYCGPVFPPSTYACTSFIVHGTISSVVCQNMMITAVLWTHFSPPPTFVCFCSLPIHSGHQWTYQPGSHRRKVTEAFSSTFFLRCVP